MTEQRRDHFRVPCSGPVKLRQPRGDWRLGELLDLSAGGMRLRIAFDLEIGQRLTVAWALGAHAYKVGARVAHSSPSRRASSPGYDLGLEFLIGWARNAQRELLQQLIAHQRDTLRVSHTGTARPSLLSQIETHL